MPHATCLLRVRAQREDAKRRQKEGVEQEKKLTGESRKLIG